MLAMTGSGMHQNYVVPNIVAAQKLGRLAIALKMHAAFQKTAAREVDNGQRHGT